MNMNMLKRNVLAVVLLAALGSPAAVLADQVPASAAASQPVVAPAPATDRMDLLQTMRTRMHEMMQTTDPAKRAALVDAQAKDMEAMAQMGPPGGMGMMMMGQGAGMMRAKGRVDQQMEQCCDRLHHAEVSNQRLDALEKRMDLMQLMLQKMMRED